MNMMVGTAIAGAAIPQAAAANVDPIYGAIAAHISAWAALEAVLHEMYELEAGLPKDQRQSNIDAWEEKIIETDDPRWIANARKLHAIHEATSDAEMGLIQVEPATLAGLAALMRHVSQHEDLGGEWPSGLHEDGDKPSSIGKSWEVYLHRNIVALLGAQAA